jgi:hypothetical protein
MDYFPQAAIDEATGEPTASPRIAPARRLLGADIRATRPTPQCARLRN